MAEEVSGYCEGCLLASECYNCYGNGGAPCRPLTAQQAPAAPVRKPRHPCEENGCTDWENCDEICILHPDFRQAPLPAPAPELHETLLHLLIDSTKYYLDFNDGVVSIFRNNSNKNLQIKVPLHPEYPDYQELVQKGFKDLLQQAQQHPPSDALVVLDEIESAACSCVWTNAPDCPGQTDGEIICDGCEMFEFMDPEELREYIKDQVKQFCEGVI